MTQLSSLCKVELQGNEIESPIGISSDKNQLTVTFPRGYNLSSSDHEIRKDIILLIKVFNKYKQRKGVGIYEKDFKDFQSNHQENYPFLIAVWLIKDYAQNGLYNQRVIINRKDKQGQVDWQKTVQRVKPIINNITPIYLDFIVKDICKGVDNVIVKIHKYIIEKCIEDIGWLYPHITINRGNTLPLNVQGCINILKKELRLSNVDSKKYLIKNMLEFLLASRDNVSDGALELNTKYFDKIWEDMLDEILGTEDARKYYPQAKWCVDNKVENTRELRPDTILKYFDKIYVLDAKYYKYGITKKINHLPQTSDITKQLVYSSYIKSKYGIDTYDAFILPYKSDGNVFKSIGSASIDIEGFNGKKVVCILADTKTVMELYVNTNNYEFYRKKIRSLIDSVANKF